MQGDFDFFADLDTTPRRASEDGLEFDPMPLLSLPPAGGLDTIDPVHRLFEGFDRPKRSREYQEEEGARLTERVFTDRAMVSRARESVSLALSTRHLGGVLLTMRETGVSYTPYSDQITSLLPIDSINAVDVVMLPNLQISLCDRALLLISGVQHAVRTQARKNLLVNSAYTYSIMRLRLIFTLDCGDNVPVSARDARNHEAVLSAVMRDPSVFLHQTTDYQKQLADQFMLGLVHAETHNIPRVLELVEELRRKTMHKNPRCEHSVIRNSRLFYLSLVAHVLSVKFPAQRSERLAITALLSFLDSFTY